MASAAAAGLNRFAGGAGEEPEEEQSVFLRDHRQSCYHVPQQSRRERLRFPTDSSLSLDSSASRIGRPAPHGPFTGYAAVLGRSRFLQPALRLLDEVCQVGQQRRRRAGYRGDALMGADTTESPLPAADLGMKKFSAVAGGEHHRRKTRLNCLLDELHRRYKRYYHQMQAVITSFEAVAGLSNAAPYASAALEVMAKHFRRLKSIIISGQLCPTTDALGNEGVNREPTLNSSCYFHGPPPAEVVTTFTQPHFWRPQRGLPERAVAVLRSWLFEHFLHPYPSDVDKQNLAKQTGLTRNQVSNWFINARVRLWKPMVEEVHALELREKSKTPGNSDQHPSMHIQEPPPPLNSLFRERSNTESTDCRNGAVSLTLGLRRNAGIHSSPPVAIWQAQSSEATGGASNS